VTAGSLRILVVDDEPAMIGVIGAFVGAAGHRIVAAYDGEEALRRFREEPPDLVLLDLAMPGVDGAAVCRAIRAQSDLPIIVVSGETDAGVTVELLDAGADDFVRKPFSGEELLARIRAVLRRERAGPARDGDWTLDRRAHRLEWRGRPVALTAIELRLAACLLEAGDGVVEGAALLAAGWPEVPAPDPTWLKPHLARLRAKLRTIGAPVPTGIRGVGYRLIPDPGPESAVRPAP
jgi:DNA-binding response OmpR family regulator